MCFFMLPPQFQPHHKNFFVSQRKIEKEDDKGR